MVVRILTILGAILMGMALTACGKKSPPDPLQPDHYPRTYPQV